MLIFQMAPKLFSNDADNNSFGYPSATAVLGRSFPPVRWQCSMCCNDDATLAPAFCRDGFLNNDSNLLCGWGDNDRLTMFVHSLHTAA